MPTPQGPDGDDPEAAAERYAAELAAAARTEDRFGLPAFDVSLLGVGEDAHVASLFPELPGIHEQERSVIAVHGSPKPPPTRISLTMPALVHGARGVARGGWRGQGGSRSGSPSTSTPVRCRCRPARRAGRAGPWCSWMPPLPSRLPRGLDRIASP